MAKYRSKVVDIEALQLTQETRASNRDWPEWMNRAWQLGRDEVGSLAPFEEGTSDGPLRIFTLEGVHKCSFGDYIVRGLEGEIYPVKPGIFEKKYDLIS